MNPRGPLDEAEDALELERAYRRGFIVGLLVSAPTSFVLIWLANSTDSGAGQAYGLISAPFAIGAIVSIVGAMVLTFGVLPETRQVVRRRQEAYDRQLVREAGL